MRLHLFPLLLVSTHLVNAAAETPVSFAREIQPILAEHCFHCHGQDEKARKSGLRLDLREAALKGGESDGPAIVPGQPEKSALLVRLKSHDPDEVMPPPKEKKPVKAEDAARLRQWIAEGAAYAKHWAFEPPAKTVPPAEGGGNPVDAFVLVKLKTLNLATSPPAEASALCRRLYLDVIGLPPSPQQVEAFAKDGFAATLDSLLRNAAFGEKWARHWLDVARYSDSNGYEKDLPREQWAWRDWVIGALNEDKPYDQFLVEQLAGDLLPGATQEQIVATGFLRNSMVNEEGAIVPEQFRMDEMFDRMDCLGKATLGLTLQCAQCHSHKFDPITQDEYYGIFAFLNNTYEAQSWVRTVEQRQQIAALTAGIAAIEERLKKERPSWPAELAAWESDVRAKEIAWTPLEATELASTSGLNHPTQEPDKSILTQGHPSTKGDIFVIAEPDLNGVTGLRFEALRHRDLPFDGPGRSKYGTWAISEMEVSVQKPETKTWEKLKLINATADFSEPEHKLENEWAAAFDKEKKRVCGPVRFLTDGSDDTGWRADRGAGQRNQESVAVVQFEKPLEFPRGTKLKVLLRYHHSGDDNGRSNTMVGRCRLSTTAVPEPRAQSVDYAAVLALQTPAPQRTAQEQAAIISAWRAGREDCKAFNEKIAAQWQKYPQAPTSVLHLAERIPAQKRATHLLDRGGWDKPKQIVEPHVPASLHPMAPGTEPDRLRFARWIADPRSPLTARVAVNRVWQAIFGSGLVETSEDFGTRAAVPEYRELLDWLAVDFMEHGWSQKRLIRTIVSSATYQQSSRATPALLDRDPRNRLLARGPRFRAEAEVVRDIALSASGLLTGKVGGPSIFPPVPASVLDYNFVKPTYWSAPEGPERYRRAIYLFRKRSMPDPALSSFDAPSSDLACARRVRSNTPLAALTALNEPIFVEAAQALALRVLREGGATDALRADYALRLCIGRAAKPAEIEEILALLKSRRARLADGWLNVREIATGDAVKLPAIPPGATPQDAAAWTIVARVLLNLDETLTKS